MDISNRTKVSVLVMVLTFFIVGLALGGPHFIHKMQVHFGAKGKLELIERCVAMKGCAISTQELELLDRLKAVQQSDVVEEIKDSELGEDIEQAEQSMEAEQN